MARKHEKALLVDSSGVYPLMFSLSEKNLKVNEIEDFFTSREIDLYFSSPTTHEFGFHYNSQGSLFVDEVSVSTQALQDVEAVYLSDSGAFSYSSYNFHKLGLSSQGVGSSQLSVEQTLWHYSPHWQYLSEEDESLISTARVLGQAYDDVAILTNDWHLRQHCKLYEGIDVYGTCSMLAGMVFADVLSYQKGTSVYHQWRKENPKWVPSVSATSRRKVKFKEILAIERERIKKGESFWVN